MLIYLRGYFYYEVFTNSSRLKSVEVNLPLTKKKVFRIEISKYEYCIPKQKHEIDAYTIYVYTPEMIVIEKLRAICQQMTEYAEIVTSPSRSARARDFYDIYILMKQFKIDLTAHQNIELIKKIFNAKRVPVTLIKNIADYREYHRPDFEAVKSTVKPKIKLRQYDFYFDYVLRVTRKLNILWEI